MVGARRAYVARASRRSRFEVTAGGLDEPRVVGETEVIVRTEVEYRRSARCQLHLWLNGRANDALRLERALRAHRVELLLKPRAQTCRGRAEGARVRAPQPARAAAGGEHEEAAVSFPSARPPPGRSPAFPLFTVSIIMDISRVI